MITTKRMKLTPLTNAEMEQLIDRTEDPGMKQAYSEMLQGCLDDPDHRIWSAVWVMKLKENDAWAGDFSFKGLGKDGTVEIGYGMQEEFMGQGLMTEAVTAVCKWAMQMPEVKRVEAETEPDNKASQRVLEKAGFVPTGSMGAEGPRFVWVDRNASRRHLICNLACLVLVLAYLVSQMIPAIRDLTNKEDLITIHADNQLSMICSYSGEWPYTSDYDFDFMYLNAEWPTVYIVNTDESVDRLFETNFCMIDDAVSVSTTSIDQNGVDITGLVKKFRAGSDYDYMVEHNMLRNYDVTYPIGQDHYLDTKYKTRAYARFNHVVKVAIVMTLFYLATGIFYSRSKKRKY